MQKEQSFNCINSEKGSIAEQNFFPTNNEGKEIKKLFMCKFNYSENKKENLFFKENDNSYVKEFFVKNCVVKVLKSIEQQLKDKLVNLSDCNIKTYLNENIGEYYNLLILPNIYFIRMVILVSIEGGDNIKFQHKLDWNKIQSHWRANPKLLINLIPYFRQACFENDFVKIFPKDIIENIHMKNLFYKKKMKNLINSNINSNGNNNFMDNQSINVSNLGNNIDPNMNKIKNFSEYSENENKFGEGYYEAFLQLLNNYSKDFQEDIETSIYDNLREDYNLKEKEENNSRKNNFLMIMDMINDNIIDEESKKGFLALLKQSFLLGKLRTNIVSIYFILYYFLNYRKKNISLEFLAKKRQENLH